MALRSKMWSSDSLCRGLGLAHKASLSLEADPDMKAMQAELLEAGPAIRASSGPASFVGFLVLRGVH